MAVSGATIYIYSNDGKTKLDEWTPVAADSSTITITENGANIKGDLAGANPDTYVYSGDKKFLGLSTQINATEPTYKIGDTIAFPAYGSSITFYIVEGEAETTTPTADSVKSKLQSLLTASNAKTGKSDANLTDAVKTLLEGYGQGGGGDNSGDCPINIVDELPATGEEGEIVGVKTFTDMYIKGEADVPDGLMGELYKEYGIAMSFIEVQSIDDIPTLDSSVPFYAFYIKNIPDIFTSGGGSEPSSAGGNTGALFRGEITDVSQATENGYYAYMKLVLYQYTNGEFKKLVHESELPTEVATEAEMTALLSTAEVGSVYKYTGETTDTYENGALYVVEEEAVNLITFTIEGTTYQAEDGMTWVEWVDSSYNTGGYYNEGGRITTGGMKSVLANENVVYPTAIITADYAYGYGAMPV